jgi:hypothetical protein
MARARLWLSGAVWVAALVIAVLVAGAGIAWAVLSVAGFVAMTGGVLLVAGGRRRPAIGWPLVVLGLAVGVLGIVQLARGL